MNSCNEVKHSDHVSSRGVVDPQPEQGKSPSKRGMGFAFGPDYTDAFLTRNNLQLLIRSHEVGTDSIASQPNLT